MGLKDQSQSSPLNLNLSGRLRFLFKDSVLYGGAGAFNKAFALVAFPILARHFSVVDYGTLDLFTSVLLLLTMVSVFGQDSAVARYFYENESLEYRKQVISQSIFYQLLTLAILCPLLFYCSDYLLPLITDYVGAKDVFLLVILQLPLMLIINFSQNILKWTFSRYKFLFVSVGSTVVSILSILLVLYFKELSILDVFKIYLYNRICFGLIGLWFVREWIELPKDRALIIKLCKFAYPLGLVGVIGAVMPMIERSILYHYLGKEELGYFAVAVKISMIIVLPIQAFQMAWGPFSLSLFKEDNSIETFNWVLKIFALVILSLAILISGLSFILITLLASNRYIEASYITYPLLMSLALESIAWITGVGIGFSKRSSYDLVSYLVYLLISILCTLIFVSAFGFYGACWGALIGSIVRSLLGTYFAQRLHFLSWSFRGVLLLAAFCLLGGVVANYVSLTVSPYWGTGVFFITLVSMWILAFSILFKAEDRLLIANYFFRVLKGKGNKEGGVVCAE